MHDDTFDHVKRFQFVQEEPGKAVLRIVPDDKYDKGDTDRIRKNLRGKLGDQLAIDLKLAESIPVSPRGKAIYLDQRIQREN